MGDPLLVATRAELEQVVARAAQASVVAVDVEGDGLFAYRAKLCTVQLAWGGGEEIAIIDTLSLDPGPLAPLLGPGGPVKLLHDLTFDARLLAESGVVLERVRDTSVAARLLGRKATGLASLLASELGLTVAKDLQQHDWSRRPLRPTEIEYLSTDVRHLETLDAKLADEVSRLDIADEVAEECLYKLRTASSPPADQRPAYLRVKGAEALDTLGLAVLRRLVAVREDAARALDVPPFKVAGNDLLLEIARRRPTARHGISSLRGGGAGRISAIVDKLLGAVRQGIDDGAVPAGDRPGRPRIDRAVAAERRAREARLTAWRRAEATARGVDEQVVLPGHCLQEIASGQWTDAPAIAEIPGVGRARAGRYAETLAALARGEPVTLPAAPKASDPPG